MTRKRFATAVALAVSVILPSLPMPSVAQDDREADLRCLAGFAARAGSATDDAGKQQATIGLIYYLGRVDGESPQTDLQAELERLGGTMTDADLKAVMPPYGERLGERGEALTKIGEALTKKAN